MSNKYTIQDIKALLFEQGCSDEQFATFQEDERKGVQKLLFQYKKQEEKRVALQRQFEEMKQFETKFTQIGRNYIAGIDEAGRGPLAGPVVAAAVILDDSFYLEGLNDSKQIKKSEREAFFNYITEHSISYGIGIVHSTEIDEVNIYEATKIAMQRAIAQLSPAPDQLLIDAVPLPEAGIPFEALVKGDQRSISIAAASILAKVTRDRFMEQIHDEYPVYHFKSNMGYGTKEHLQSIDAYGVTPYHRKSYAPVRNAMKK